jgi:mannose-6-phosphate isomerase-like protein (cupin superfamily)
MAPFDTRTIPERPDDLAPDGSDVRVLARVGRGSAAHFSLDPGCVSVAVMHRTIDEIWYFLGGEDEFWRQNEEGEEASVQVQPGVCITIPARTKFQFRSTGHEPLTAFGITMPPWPGSGPGEVEFVPGVWTAKLPTREST